MKDANTKVKIIIVSSIAIIMVTIGLYIYKTYKEESDINFIDYNAELESNESISQETTNENMNTNEENDKEKEKIIVHITGEVKYAGVVVLKEGARIVDAIEAAGGETDNADLNKLNLAYIVSDGDKIYVPNKNEEIGNITTVNEEINSEEQSTININTASLKELMELPGIGEVTANKIIEYRTQNGKFSTIEELKNVPGIGSSKFENLKEKIRVK